VIQLGEEPENVFWVGALGIENIARLQLLSKPVLETKIGFRLGPSNALVTLHPVTLENNTAADQIHALLDAIDEFPDMHVVFTRANADTHGRIINKRIDEYVAGREKSCAVYSSLGQQLYLSVMSHVDLVIGNSSSGIIEAPSFRIPTVNIGDRQQGRIRAASVIDCSPEKKQIMAAIEKGLSKSFRKKIETMKNPYEKPNPSGSILNAIKSTELDGILVKRFHDVL
jgi:GDP/UDP-N,N'-diacetylbacillosamine 2-epimerase (hydrolysing)